jgi:glycosyltransferase involved in cell wall biosynthesis
MEKISACLVVHNEEKLIGRCLDSLCGMVDEIILIHDGECNDKTLEIAGNYGTKIFVRPFIGGAEEHRPFSYEQASNNWILQIDADEFLSEELRNNLQSLVSDKDISAYEILWPLWDGKKETKILWPYKRCLFRKNRISFLGIIHFVIEVNGKIKKVNYKLHHQPAYDNFSRDSFLSKQLPWAKLQASYYLKDFSEIKKYNWSGTEWPKLIKYRVKFPLLFLPIEFIWTLLKNIFNGAYRVGLIGLKSAYRAALYRAAMDYYIYKLKK